MARIKRINKQNCTHVQSPQIGSNGYDWPKTKIWQSPPIADTGFPKYQTVLPVDAPATYSNKN